jgi:hypothetical protein
VLDGMGHETADLVDRVGVEQVHNFWAAHSAVRFRHSRLRVHGGYLSGGSLVTATDEPLSGWSVAHPTSANVGCPCR